MNTTDILKNLLNKTNNQQKKEMTGKERTAKLEELLKLNKQANKKNNNR